MPPSSLVRLLMARTAGDSPTWSGVRGQGSGVRCQVSGVGPLQFKLALTEYLGDFCYEVYGEPLEGLVAWIWWIYGVCMGDVWGMYGVCIYLALYRRGF